MSISDYTEEKQPDGISKVPPVLMALISAILGGSALWLMWSRYGSPLNRLDLSWYHWIQLAFLALTGILCLSAAILFMTGKPSGWSVFKAGISMIPILLFSNLVVLIIRVIQNVVQGNGIAFLLRLYVSPLNKAILGLVIVLILLSMLKETKKS